MLHLTIEADGRDGQLRQAVFEPHDGYSQTHNGWSRSSQGRRIKPSTVRQIIVHAIGNGWQPTEQNSNPFRIHAWDADQIVPRLTDLPVDQFRLRDVAIEQVCDLQYDLSLDPLWRKRLFDAPVFERFPLAEDYFALSAESREHGLKYCAFNDGGEGFVVFGIQSIDFPDVVAYTTNNPAII